MKTVLFVPGFQEDIKFRDYPATIAAIKSRGYNVKFVPIKWARTTIDDWAKQLEEEYSKHDPKETILAGFSYGSMTAFVVATKRQPYGLWLFSLSPYFAEDHKSKNMKPTWLKQIGHRRVDSFAKLNFAELAGSVTCKTILLAGALEIKKWPVIGERVKIAHKLLKNNEFIIVDGAGHDVAHPNYIEAIKRAI